MSKLGWLILPLCLLLGACNPGDNPRMEKDAALVEAQAKTIEDGKFDAEAFKREMGPVAVKWDGKHYQPFGKPADEKFHKAFERLIDAVDKSGSDEAKRLLADVLHNMDPMYLSEKMKNWRGGYPAPPEDAKWWADDKAAAANTPAGNG